MAVSKQEGTVIRVFVWRSDQKAFQLWSGLTILFWSLLVLKHFNYIYLLGLMLDSSRLLCLMLKKNQISVDSYAKIMIIHIIIGFIIHMCIITLLLPHWILICWVITMKGIRWWVFVVLCYRYHMLMGESDPGGRFGGVNSCRATLLFQHFLSLCGRLKDLPRPASESPPCTGAECSQEASAGLCWCCRDSWGDVGEVREDDPFQDGGVEPVWSSQPSWGCSLPVQSQLKFWLMRFSISMLFFPSGVHLDKLLSAEELWLLTEQKKIPITSISKFPFTLVVCSEYK